MIEHIVIATDGSKTANAAAARGVDFAIALGARITFVTCNPPHLADEIFAGLLNEFAAAGVDLDTYSDNGDPAAVILDAAEKLEADLIVVGNKGMQGIRRVASLTRVTARVLHHAERPVLIVQTT